MIKQDIENSIFNRRDDGRDANVVGIAYRANKVIQSAEMNEQQSIAHHRHKQVGDILFKNGDVVAGGSAKLDHATGKLNLDAGQIYVAGNIVTVDAAELMISTVGTVTIGVYVSDNYLTEDDDPTLRNPAVNTRGANEPGGWRVVRSVAWGIQGDGRIGDFHSVYIATDGYMEAKSPPPDINSITQTIAKYDRDSTGSRYVIDGLNVRAVDAGEAGKQGFVVDAGRARINGYAIEFGASRRFIVDNVADKALVDSEPHLSDGSEQRVNVNRGNIANIEAVRITSQKTVLVTHANHNDSSDSLPDSSVISVESITQNGKSFAEGVDFSLTTGEINWSADGDEPLPGSSYSVTYRYIRVASPTAVDSNGFTVTGAVKGTLILVSYQHYLQRIDRITLDDDGVLHLLRGVSGIDNLLPPQVPANLLLLATVYQTWLPQKLPNIVQDGSRLVTMESLNHHAERLDYLTEQLAKTRLEQSAGMRESGRKHGLFADPFLTDELRDLGHDQSAVIDGGMLSLPIDTTSVFLNQRSAVTLTYNFAAVISQTLKTECMKINPYSAFEPLPASVKITPAIDRWVFNTTSRSSSSSSSEETITLNRRRTVWWRTNPFFSVNRSATRTTSQQRTVSVSRRSSEFLRNIELTVDVAGLGSGERIASVSFDGVPISVNAVANSTGAAQFRFTIPNGIPAGRKQLVVSGAGGTTGDAVFVGEGEIVNTHTHTHTNTHTRRRRIVTRNVDPLAQTFMLSEQRQITAIDLHFCAAGQRNVAVQIRETLVGIPTNVVLAESIVHSSAMSTSTATQFVFEELVTLEANTEYAIVVMSDESEPAVSVASLGAFDKNKQQWVTAQPYTVGVLLSSSNASTWTAHNDKDLAFTLFAANFSQRIKTVQLGSCDVTDMTDLRVFIDEEKPAATTNIIILATLPDESVVELSNAQIHSFNESISGTITLAAQLHGSDTMSPILYPSVQLMIGSIESTGNYISRAIPAGLNSRVRVIVDAFLPTGSELDVSARDVLQEDWQDLVVINSLQLDNGMLELSYETTADISAANIQTQLVLTGSASARAFVQNLRVLVI